MTRARNQQISLDDTPYYHCISRCVRRAHLCGDDPITGQNFDHRKQWLVSCIKQLSASFAIDVCAYAVMSDHYHLVLFVDQEKASTWSDKEVIRRWTKMFPRNVAILETLRQNSKSRAAQRQMKQQVTLWRERLSDISWFMRCLNEHVARRANKEDDCRGRFWEGRFKSQALLDEKALVTCMAYVDLNPIRAGVSDSLDKSDFTSIQERLINHAKKVKNRSYRQNRLLMRRSTKHLVGRQSTKKQSVLKQFTDMPGLNDEPISLCQQSYFALLESTSKALKLLDSNSGKAINVLEDRQLVLQRIGISSDSWLKSVKYFHQHYAIAAGSETSLIEYHKSRIKAGVEFKYPNKWIRGLHSARLLYGT